MMYTRLMAKNKITLCIIASLLVSCMLSYKIFHNGDNHEFPRNIALIIDESISTDNALSIVQPLKISFDYNDSRILAKNFLDSENGGRWNEGKHSAIKFLIKDTMNDLNVKITGVPLFGKNFKRQKIAIYANGTFVEIWDFNENTNLPATINVSIPHHLVKNHQLELGFLVHNPKSPKELGINNDSRLIGFAIQSLTISSIFNTDINTSLKKTPIQLAFTTKKYRNKIPFDIFIDEKLQELSLDKLFSEDGYTTVVVEIDAIEANISIKANEFCHFCELTFNIIVPESPENKDKLIEKIVKIINIKEDDMTIINPPNSVFLSSSQKYWISTSYLSDKTSSRDIYLKWCAEK